MKRLPERLLPWYEKNRRDLPWRKDRAPYHVWLSEIMLQQTRVEAVKRYYARFLETLPDTYALAEAAPETLQKLWEGLGYYSRVRNLQKAAKVIVSEYGGAFPRDYDSIRALPGIGDYTAGAIASICFDLPAPAVDGNVERVLTRYLADCRPADPKLRGELRKALASVYPKDRPGDFTQSLMELGAVVCTPNGEPDCENCPLAVDCKAHAQGNETDFPVRIPKKPRRVEAKTVFIFRCGDQIAVRKRPETGLLAGLWELPNTERHLSLEAAIAQAEAWGVHPSAPESVKSAKHIFTHIEWDLRCYTIECAASPDLFRWVTWEELQTEIALPTAFRICL